MASITPLISRSLRTNEAFLSDLVDTMQLPLDCLQDVWKLARPPRRPDQKAIDALAAKWDRNAGAVYRYVRICAYLIEGALMGGHSGEEAVAEIAEVIGLNTPDFRMPEGLRGLFVFNEEERTFVLTKQAFSAPPTYLDVEIRPVFVPSPKDDAVLLGGYFLTIGYTDTRGSNQEVTFGISGGELREISEAIESAERKLEQLSGRIGRGTEQL